MSLTFTELTTLTDDIAKSNSTSYPVAKKVRDINMGLDKVFSIIFEVGGTWQFDDSNHTDYPIIQTNLVDGQRDYQFVEDGSSNLVLEIHKVLVATEDGIYQELKPVDQQTDPAMHNFWDGQDVEGTPYRYDKTANAIFLDPIPSYNETNGLKVYINREASYFTTSDTTKKAGFAGIFHKYLAYYAAYEFAFRNGLKTQGQIYERMLQLEKDIREYYGRRQKDVKPVLRERRKAFK